MARSRLGQGTIGRADPVYLRCLEDLQRLRRFTGDPAQFWSSYLQILLKISNGVSAVIAIRDERNNGGWRFLAASRPGLTTGPGLEQLTALLTEVADECFENGAAWGSDREGGEILTVRLFTGNKGADCLVSLSLKRGHRVENLEALKRVQLVSDVPASYQLQRVASESITRVEHFASVLDLMVLINGEKRFLAAAMTFCNELASRHHCERVSLGWLHRGYVRLQTMSHVDHFDRKTEAVQNLERAMEEALDQNSEITIPNQPGGVISRDHQSFAHANDVPYLCSLPLREEEEPTAVCTCERSSAPFSETELRLLRLSCDQAVRRLADLKRSDRWIGARLAAGAGEKLGRIFGYEHTGIKIIVLLIAAALGTAIFGRFPYRVKAPVILRTDDLTYMTAPFDGHIEKVLVRVGDEVETGEELLRLDQNQLLLREAELIAEKNRYSSEFEKARAAGSPADMRITQALYDQSDARHKLVRYQLDRSVVRAPFSGIIVEGDLKERIGLPVHQGDLLFKIARIERLYAELKVSETDIHQVEQSLQGEIALASRPEDVYRIEVFRIEPIAVAEDKGNVFIVHASFPTGFQDWWRPGMTGVAKLEIGDRSLIWIATHRTVDFLRLRLWW
jgi:multidrug efflux pump subunit AcrA (membrane-fusion protein)